MTVLATLGIGLAKQKAHQRRSELNGETTPSIRGEPGGVSPGILAEIGDSNQTHPLKDHRSRTHPSIPFATIADLANIAAVIHVTQPGSVSVYDMQCPLRLALIVEPPLCDELLDDEPGTGPNVS